MNPSGAHSHEDKLLEFAYGELPPSEARQVEAHVKGCLRCSGALEGIQGVRGTMSRLEVEPAPDAGLESLLAYAQQTARRAEAGPAPQPTFWRRLWMPLAGAAALVVVGVVANQTVLQTGPFKSAPPTAAAEAKAKAKEFDPGASRREMNEEGAMAALPKGGAEPQSPAAATPTLGVPSSEIAEPEKESRLDDGESYDARAKLAKKAPSKSRATDLKEAVQGQELSRDAAAVGAISVDVQSQGGGGGLGSLGTGRDSADSLKGNGSGAIGGSLANADPAQRTQERIAGKTARAGGVRGGASAPEEEAEGEVAGGVLGAVVDGNAKDAPASPPQLGPIYGGKKLQGYAEPQQVKQGEAVAAAPPPPPAAAQPIVAPTTKNKADWSNVGSSAVRQEVASKTPAPAGARPADPAPARDESNALSLRSRSPYEQSAAGYDRGLVGTGAGAKAPATGGRGDAPAKPAANTVEMDDFDKSFGGRVNEKKSTATASMPSRTEAEEGGQFARPARKAEAAKVALLEEERKPAAAPKPEPSTTPIAAAKPAPAPAESYASLSRDAARAHASGDYGAELDLLARALRTAPQSSRQGLLERMCNAEAQLGEDGTGCVQLEREFPSSALASRRRSNSGGGAGASKRANSAPAPREAAEPDTVAPATSAPASTH